LRQTGVRGGSPVVITPQERRGELTGGLRVLERKATPPAESHMDETVWSQINGTGPSQIGGTPHRVWAPKQDRAARMLRSSRPVRLPGQFTGGLGRVPTIEHVTIQRMDHVGIVVDDLADAVAFFAQLGLELQGEAPVEGDWVDRVVGLEGVRAQIAILQTPDGHGRLELTKFHTPSTDGGYQRVPANASGIRHVAFAVDNIDAVLARLRARGAELIGELGRYQDIYRLCYVRGPEGIIVELAEQIG
jgi:catechol 2,3-dioxygenase-like lactoylglutathione lyase family enzyme